MNINFVNLLRDNTNEIPVPVFGIDKVLSYFKNSIKKEEWNELRKVCKMGDEKKCKELCENIPYLRMCSDFIKLNKKIYKSVQQFAFGGRMLFMKGRSYINIRRNEHDRQRAEKYA